MQGKGKSKGVCIGLCCCSFIGLGGLHDFYLRRYGIGFLKLITINFFLIGTFIDLYNLVTDNYYYFKTLKQIRERKNAGDIQNPINFEEEIDEEDERDADYLYMRVEKVINQKIDRAVDKNIITRDEADILTQDLEFAMETQSTAYWVNFKGEKTFNICLDLLKDKNTLEILEKIEKA